MEGMIANPVEAGKRRDPTVKHDPYFMSLNVTFVTQMLHPAIRKEVPTEKQEEKEFI